MSNADDATLDLDADTVAAWLRANPEFLQNHPELLDSLAPPDRGGGVVVDLQRFMVERHRDELKALRGTTQDLLTVARANQSSQASIMEATLLAIRATNFEALIDCVTEQYPQILHMEAVTFCVEGSPSDGMSMPPGVPALSAGDVDGYLCGAYRRSRFISDMDPDPTLFGPAAGIVRSAALVRLDIAPDAPKAMLAFGAREPGSFDLEQADDLLAFLGSALGGTVSAWLDLHGHGH